MAINKTSQLLNDYQKASIYDDKEDIGLKITKKIKAVKVLDDYEQAQTEGLKSQLAIFFKYVNGIDNGSEGYIFDSSIKKIFTELLDARGLIKYPNVSRVVNLLVTVATSPLWMGALCAIAGIRSVKFIHLIKNSPEFVQELQEAGIYDTIKQYWGSRVDSVEREDAYDHSGVYDSFINESILPGKVM